MAHNILQSVSLLAATARNFAKQCVAGLKANPERLKELSEKNISLCTVLVPSIGYERAAEIAREAYQTGKPLREVVVASGLLTEAQFDEILAPEKMTNPHGSIR